MLRNVLALEMVINISADYSTKHSDVPDQNLQGQAQKPLRMAICINGL
jgi:hypothetical protein